jgi:hypothetical protein
MLFLHRGTNASTASASRVQRSTTPTGTARARAWMAAVSASDNPLLFFHVRCRSAYALENVRR